MIYLNPSLNTNSEVTRLNLNFGHFFQSHGCTSVRHIKFLLCDGVLEEKVIILYFPRGGLRPFFGSHTRTSHVQIWVRTHTCAHVQFKVVALRTRTRTFWKSTFFSTIFHQFFTNFSPISRGSCYRARWSYQTVLPDGLTRWS